MPEFAWEAAGLIKSGASMYFPIQSWIQLEPESLSWSTNYHLEQLLTELSNRHETLSKLMQLTKEETVLHADEIHQAVVACEEIDASWLRELELRRGFKQGMDGLAASAAKVKEQDDAIDEMAREERLLDSERKQHLSDISNVSQGVLRYRSKFEDSSHHLNTFATGVGFAKELAASANVLSSVAEQMRCSFNELRRVNASLEEKLVLSGVSKQKLMVELKSIFVDIRSSCTKNPGRHKQTSEEALEDLNLTAQVLKDMNSVWRATLPTVPALSGDPAHAALLTFLSASMGHFAEECVNEMTDLCLVSQSSADRVREEAKLAAVISVETHRYRSISGALKSAIKDSEMLLDTAAVESLGQVVSGACTLMKHRLGCSVVTFWARDGDHWLGFSSASNSRPLEVESPTGSMLFETSSSGTVRLDQSELPGDIRAVKSYLGSSADVSVFSIAGKAGGLTIIRKEDDLLFPPFSGIYCEQFYRRIVSAIPPLEMVLNRRIADQMPLDLAQPNREGHS